MHFWIFIFTGIVAATATYFVSTRLRQGPVRASALLTLLVAGFCNLFPQLLSPHLAKNIPVVFIGASFIGMVSSQHLSTYLGLSASSIIFTIIYLNTSKLFTGYGGALGLSACISLLVVLSIPYFKSKRKLTVGFLQLRRLMFGRKKEV